MSTDESCEQMNGQLCCLKFDKDGYLRMEIHLPPPEGPTLTVETGAPTPESDTWQRGPYTGG